MLSTNKKKGVRNFRNSRPRRESTDRLRGSRHIHPRVKSSFRKQHKYSEAGNVAVKQTQRDDIIVGRKRIQASNVLQQMADNYMGKLIPHLIQHNSDKRVYKLTEWR